MPKGKRKAPLPPGQQFFKSGAAGASVLDLTDDPEENAPKRQRTEAAAAAEPAAAPPAESKMDEKADKAAPPAEAKRDSAAQQQPAAVAPASRDDSKRRFNPKWQKKRKWLRFQEAEPGRGMYCDLCKGAGKEGVWCTAPCTTIKKTAVETHEKSNTHRNVLKDAEKDPLQAHLALMPEDEDIFDAWTHVFYDLHWLAYEEVSTMKAKSSSLSPLLSRQQRQRGCSPP